MFGSAAGASVASRWGAVLAGMLVAFPGVVGVVGGVTGGAWPRTTDLLNLVCGAWFVFAMLKTSRLHPVVLNLFVVWALTLPWVLWEVYELGGDPDPPVQRLVIRWIMCGGAACMVTMLSETPVLRPCFFYGLLAGVAASSSTLVYDFLTFSPHDMPVEELVTLAIYNGKDLNDFVYRAFGIFGHPNGAAGCVLIGVPVLIGLIQEGKAPRWSVVLALGFMGGVFYLTKSRGPLVVAAGLVGYWLWLHSRGFRLPLVLAGAVAALAGLAANELRSGGESVLLERFLDMDAITVNADDRWWTIATSLDLLLRHPFGMGSAYVAPLEIATGTSATHNAYLELGLMGGLPIMVFVIVRLVRAAGLLFTPWRPVEAWLAAYLLGIFAFESYFLQVNIQLLTLWLVVSPLQSFARQATPQSRARTHAMAGQRPAMGLSGGRLGREDAAG
jgi:hypothetical protein